jgi:outer membrane protein assembly factor BamB
MKAYPNLTRWLAGIVTVGIFAVIVIVVVVARNAAKTDNTPAGKGKDAPEVKASATSWPMFGGSASRNMVNPFAKNLPAKWDVDDKTNIKWVADLGSKAYGGPVVAGGKVFIGTNNMKPRDPKYTINEDGKLKPIDMGVLMAFSEDKGDFLWQRVYAKLKAGRVNDWPQEGLCSTPVVEGDRLYFTSNRCEVICAPIAGGEPHWKLDMIKELGVFPHNITACSPLLVGDKLFIVTANGVDEDHINVPAPRAPSFLCLHKKNGKVIWQNNNPSKMLLEVPKKGDQESFFQRLVNRGELLQHGQWSNPAYAVVNGLPQVIFPGGDGWIYSFEPGTGKLIWKFDCNPKDAKYALKTGPRSDFIATPVIYDDKVYIGIGQDPEHGQGVGHLWCIDMTKKGDVSPELVTDASRFPPKTKPNPNSAKVWHYGGKADVNKVRRAYYFGRTMSTCAIHDDLLYVAELAGYLHCLDAKTGKVHWVFDAESEIWSSPYYADGKIYLGTDNGTLFVFAHGKQMKLLAKNEMGSAVRATPVAVNGTLFIMTENKLFAVAEKK